MDSKLKQRVIGAIVLTALAIIILPMLLDGSQEDRARVVASIPEPPAIELESVSLEDIDQKMLELEQESAARLPDMVEDDTDYGEGDPEELTLDKNNLPVSWSLQVGAFQNEDNALRLQESLRESEFRTYIIRAPSDEGEVYKVFVGPMLQKSKLAAIGEEIESKFDLKGRIVRYDIEADKGQLGPSA